MGVKACYISGEQDDQRVKEGVVKGDYQLVYFTPEMILGSRIWREMLVGEVYAHRLRTFVVDEAHTVKKWYTTRYVCSFSCQTCIIIIVQGRDCQEASFANW